MLFTAYAFLFFFLPLIVLLARSLRGQTRNLVLVITSFAFYGWWRIDFMLLFIGSSVMNYCAGKWLASAAEQRRKSVLITFVGLNLLVLAWFKYANFGIENWNAIMKMLDFDTVSWSKLILPVGISFYTFQAISYLVDLYRRKVSAAENWIDFACYLALFTHIAGPIVRFVDVLPELKRPALELSLLERGAFLFMVGFCKKVFIANNVAPVVEAMFGSPDPGAAGAWLGLLAYTLQIYFDFSGYSDMAIGLGYMIGFKFPMNFDSPYQATSITDFWRRWHLTLSHWLRDYLYFPLGGSRGGAWRTALNLFLVMLLGGLWHGANWTFVIWGAYHGLWLAGERFLGGKSLLENRVPGWLNRVFVLLLITLSWIPFRVESLPRLGDFLGELFSTQWQLPALGEVQQPWFWGCFILGWFIALFAPNSQTLADRTSRVGLTFLFLALFLIALHELFSQELNPFLYFQF